MKGIEAVIKVFVPEFQIGQKVTVFFPDTMIQKGACEANPVVHCKDCRNGCICKDETGKNVVECFKTYKQRLLDWFCADGERKDK